MGSVCLSAYICIIAMGLLLNFSTLRITLGSHWKNLKVAYGVIELPMTKANGRKPGAGAGWLFLSLFGEGERRSSSPSRPCDTRPDPELLGAVCCGQ